MRRLCFLYSHSHHKLPDYGNGQVGMKRPRYEERPRYEADENQAGTVTFSLISTSFFTAKVCYMGRRGRCEIDARARVALALCHHQLEYVACLHEQDYLNVLFSCSPVLPRSQIRKPTPAAVHTYFKLTPGATYDEKASHDHEITQQGRLSYEIKIKQTVSCLCEGTPCSLLVFRLPLYLDVFMSS